MRHKIAGVKLNRTTSHRQAMFRNMVTSLFKYDRIRTTDVKAKELRRWVDHIITLAKQGDLHARRQVLAIVREKDVVHKIFAEAEKRFGNISGGYTRIIKIGRRPGDSAPISLIELTVLEEKAKKEKKKSKAKKQDKIEAKSAATEKQPIGQNPPTSSEAEPATSQGNPAEQVRTAPQESSTEVQPTDDLSPATDEDSSAKEQ